MVMDMAMGDAENAGVENAARSKLHRWKMQEWKYRDGVCLKECDT